MVAPQRPPIDPVEEHEILRVRLRATPTFEPPAKKNVNPVSGSQVPLEWSSFERTVSKLELTISIAGGVVLGVFSSALFVWAGATPFPGSIIAFGGGVCVGFLALRAIFRGL